MSVVRYLRITRVSVCLSVYAVVVYFHAGVVRVMLGRRKTFSKVKIRVAQYCIAGCRGDEVTLASCMTLGIIRLPLKLMSKVIKIFNGNERRTHGL